MGFGQNTPANQSAIDILTRRLIDKDLAARVDTSSTSSYIRTMEADGSWPDVNYVDSSMATWKPLTHLGRLKVMAISWHEKESRFYHDDGLKTKILLGLDYYLKRRPQSRNWWYRDIGAPQVYMVTLLMLKGYIDHTALMHYAGFLKDATDNPAHKGKNRSWVSEITIYKGCIEDNIKLIARGFHSIASELVVDTLVGGEGIKADYGFHQHHAQLYSGGYGLSLMSDYSSYVLLTCNTPFSDVFTPEKLELFENLLLEGHQRLGYRQVMDFGTMGRNISRKNNRAFISSAQLDEMIRIDTVHKADYRAWQQHIKGGEYPKAYRGNYDFWLSDIMTQHGSNYYLSAKIISKRTVGTESLNSENLKGYNLPLGSTNILVSGNEYQDIYPVWDWSRIPGTTAEMSDQATHLQGYLNGNNAFGGGVSDGKSGLTAFESNYRGIAAKKAYFFMDNAMICLGAGISAVKDHPIVTSVNQCLANGNVIADKNLRWAFHDSVGYIFPIPAQVKLRECEQHGTWKSINESGAPDTVSRRVFNLWIDHGNQPANASYQYIVVPGKSLKEFERYRLNHNLVILKNDTVVQAVRDKTGKNYAVVFYHAGSVELDKGFLLNTDGPVLMLIHQAENGYTISCADPIYAQSGVNIWLNKILHGAGVNVTSGVSKVHIMFPTGAWRGKTITSFYSKN